MEWLLVEFPEDRGVLIDGLSNGKTNTKFELEEGPHQVSLAPPSDFSPTYQNIVLKGTNVNDPMTISFIIKT